MNQLYRIVLTIFCCLVSNVAYSEDEVLRLLKELKAQVNTLQHQLDKSNARISELEKERQTYRTEQQQTLSNASTGPVQVISPPVFSQTIPVKSNEKPIVTVGDVKGTFKIPETETSLSFGGYIKTDVLLNNMSAGRDRMGDQQLVLSQIPVGGAPGEHSQLTFHGKESRIWFKSYTTSSWGDLNTLLEMDFYGDPATYTYTPRLRHAYGSIGNFLAGQTWTTFLNVAATPDILDNGGSAGAISNLRQPLVRWTQPFFWTGTPIELQMALEAPRSRLFDNTSTSLANITNSDTFFQSPNADRYPDIVSRVNLSPDWGNLSLSTMARQIRYTNTTGFQQDTWGGAVSLAGKINTYGMDNIRFMTHYGNAHGRYVATTNTFADATLSSNGNLDLVTAYGAMLSYQHWWNKQWRSNITYGISRADESDYASRLLNQHVQSIHANLLWSPISQTMLGMEYIFASRELLNGQVGDLHRLQFSARYNF